MSSEGPAEPGAAPAVRASDAERERTATLLRDHAAAGRITPEELSDRLDVAYAARTVAELDALLADLPPAAGAEASRPAVSPQRDEARRRVLHAIGVAVLVNLVAIGIWLASGTEGSFWPKWVLLLSAVRFAFLAWAELGPAGAHRDDGGLGRGGVRRIEREALREQLREERVLRRSRRRS